MSWVTLFAAAEIVWVVGICVWIVLERRSPQATLAWIFALVWLPFLGIAVYLLVGPRRLVRKRRRYVIARSLVKQKTHPIRDSRQRLAAPVVDLHLEQYMAMMQRLGEAPPLRAHRLEVLPSGDCCYQALAEAIAAARHHVHLEYYIWNPDRAGTRLRDALCAAARRGVEVRLLLDAIGSARVGRAFLAPLHAAGAQTAWFNRLALRRLRPGWINFRTHRKIVVCDGRVGFTGGINVADDHSVEFFGPLARRDTHVRLEGPPVQWLQSVFLEDWHFAAGDSPSGVAYFPRDEIAPSGPWVQIVSSGPDTDRYAIQKFFFAAIAAARQRVLIATPYFVPDEPILQALANAALRGVEVRILVPRRNDSWVVAAAAGSYLADLLRSGVRVFLYGPAMLHAKTLVVDEQIGVIGTANMDNRSFRLNFEVMAVIYDGPTAALLSEQYHADLARAEEYRIRDLKRVSWARQLFQLTARLLSPVL